MLLIRVSLTQIKLFRLHHRFINSLSIENLNLLQGNYKGFGDTKIVPDVLPEIFEKIVTSSKAWSEDEEAMQAIWSAIKGPMVCYLKINQFYICMKPHRFLINILRIASRSFLMNFH